MGNAIAKTTVKMEKKQDQQSEKKPEEKGSLERLPMEDSPYLKYKDLEDYKRQGYGTEGHLQPKPGRGAGATDAPTLSGAAASSEDDASGAIDAITAKESLKILRRLGEKE